MCGATRIFYLCSTSPNYICIELDEMDMKLVTKEEALKLFVFQYYFGIIFALAGVVFSGVMYFYFRDSAVPVTGSNERLNPLLVSLISAVLAAAFGAACSLVVRPVIRRLKAEIGDAAGAP